MKIGFLTILAIAPVLVLACGDDEDGEDGPAPDLAEACEEYCAAAVDTPGCGEALAGCESACTILADQLGGACEDAYASLYACAADGEFECMDGYPIPSGTECASEAFDLSQCLQEAPCLEFCDAAAAAGCGGAGCQDACKASQETSCGFEIEDVMECEVAQGVVCLGAEPSFTPACKVEVLELAECLAYDDPCAGHCVAAEVEGCAGESRDACVSACQAALGGPCSSERERLLECDARYGVSCTAGAPVPSQSCQSEQESLDACIASAGG
jgi:hypothetical protein